jgi:hypothetical protein
MNNLDEYCSICLEILSDNILLDCNHSFCGNCINKWKEKNNNCPICRSKIDDDTQIYHTNVNMTDNIVDIEDLIDFENYLPRMITLNGNYNTVNVVNNSSLEPFNVVHISENNPNIEHFYDHSDPYFFFNRDNNEIVLGIGRNDGLNWNPLHRFK